MKISLASVQVPHWWTIVLSLVVAIFLALMPMPELLRYAKPDWIGLVVIYWVLHLPRHLGVFFGWSAGILHDILSFSLLGLNALGKSLIAAVISTSAYQIKHFSMIKQSFIVFVLQSFNVAIIAWINYLTIGTEVRLAFWQSAIASALLWPFISTILNRLDPFRA